jgi:hypothetical protein
MPEPTTICIFREDEPYLGLMRIAKALHFGLLARVANKLTGHGNYRRNPRPRKYMEECASSVLPDFEKTTIVDATDIGKIQWDSVSNVVLLWRDAIGVGWSGLEREVFRRTRSGAQVHVLNGRRRYFPVSRGALTGFRWRRFLDKTFVVDVFLAALLLLLMPVLWVVDLARGKS